VENVEKGPISITRVKLVALLISEEHCQPVLSARLQVVMQFQLQRCVRRNLGAPLGKLKNMISADPQIRRTYLCLVDRHWCESPRKAAHRHIQGGYERMTS
jgi:hypothetical protein